MAGEYIITERDIAENRIFEDTVAYGGWPLDDHFPDGFFHKGRPNTNVATPAPYCIPYRAMYSKNVLNLFFAGRNISMTHFAMSSIRVMMTCAVMGQAVGTAAAIASRFNIPPHGVYLEKLQLLQDLLLDNDCFLPNKKRHTSSLCRKTDISNGSSLLKNSEDRPHKIYNSSVCGDVIQNGTVLEYKFGGYEHIHKIHITFDSDLERETLPGGECERTHSMRCNTLSDSPQFYVPKTLCREFILEADGENGNKFVLRVENNRKRSYSINIDTKVKNIRLTPLSNYGNTDETAVFSFDFK